MSSCVGVELRRRRWRSVQLRHLAGFEAIARTCSFRAAAANLGYGQSAVSQQLAHLERLAGARLVDRAPGTGPTSLTPAGHALVPHATAVLSCFQAAKADVESLLDAREGPLRVGAIPSVAAWFVPHATARGVDLFLTETPTEAPLPALIERGDLDVAFCELPLPDGPFDWVELPEDPYVLLAASDDPVATPHEAPIPPEIARMPIVCLAADRSVADWLRAHGAEPCVRCDLVGTAQALVAERVGVAIVPRLGVDPGHPGTTVLELPDLPVRTLALLWHRERPCPRAADVLAELV
jgi:DNA-binding transcriptional LysR family regulator